MTESGQKWDSGEVWQEKTEAAIAVLSDRLDIATQKRFKLDLLKHCLPRIVQFEPDCHDCRLHRENIRLLLKEADTIDIQSKEVRKNFSRQIRETSEHLIRTHKLATPWSAGSPFALIALFVATYQNTFLALGLGIGVIVAIMILAELFMRKHDRIL